jgi:hypothetical protein
MSQGWKSISLLVLLNIIPCLANSAQAQGGGSASTGNVGIYNNGLSYSTAYIDASVYYTGSSGPDICQIINNVLTSAAGYTPYPTTTGAVVDTRGILVPLGQQPPLPCGSNPFLNVTAPSTILLPAISIQPSVTWTLPSNTRIVGENSQISQLTAISGWSSGNAIVEMCPGTTVCTGVSVEHLKIVAPTSTSNGLGVDGIDNYSAQDGSYVDDVVLSGFGAFSTYRKIKNSCSKSHATRTGSADNGEIPTTRITERSSSDEWARFMLMVGCFLR